MSQNISGPGWTMMSSMRQEGDDRAGALVGVAVGALGPIAVALVLVPVRT